MACTETTVPTDQDSDTDGAVEDRGFADTLAPVAELSDGECPDLSTSGTATFSSGGFSRSIQVFRPSNLEAGAPLVFAWHGAGDSAGNFALAIDAQAFADANDALVIVPSQSPEARLLPWVAEPDTALFDDVRACASTELNIDLERVYTTGFSAGALWSAELILSRADTLATAFLMSGGLLVPYETPAAPIPVLMSEGGESDVVAVVRFKETTEKLAGELTADEHVVVVCSHTGGHTPPPGFRDLMADWLFAHRYGRTSPFVEDGAELPEICRTWE